jgi:F420-0:gamma-glutamyl ligase-like protein
MKSDKNIFFEAIPIKTPYIRPNKPYDVIIDRVSGCVRDGDFLVISETPLSISQGRIVDESKFKPSWKAYFLADWWSKYLWGYFLGPLLGIKKRTMLNLRKLPPEARNHKQMILEFYGWKHALKPASEAGVDLSNVPGSYVSLLPEHAQEVATRISSQIESRTGKMVTTLIIDTDATYKLGDMIFTSLPYSIKGIKNDMGILGYLLGRFGRIMGPTPLGVSKDHEIGIIFDIARQAEQCQEC